jgi:hypothetical protein
MASAAPKRGRAETELERSCNKAACVHKCAHMYKYFGWNIHTHPSKYTHLKLFFTAYQLLCIHIKNHFQVRFVFVLIIHFLALAREDANIV